MQLCKQILNFTIRKIFPINYTSISVMRHNKTVDLKMSLIKFAQCSTLTANIYILANICNMAKCVRSNHVTIT